MKNNFNTLDKTKFLHLLELLNSLSDFSLLALVSTLKYSRTKEEVNDLLIEFFGLEKIKLLPVIEPIDLLNLVTAEFNARNLN